MQEYYLKQMNTSQRLSAIRQELTANSDEKAKAASRRFVPTAEPVYGVRVPLLNQLTKEHREGGFELVEALWKSGAFEERLLAAKLLGSLAKKDPEKALTLAKEFAPEVSDWAVCDALGVHGLRGLVLKKQKELLAWSNQLSKSKNLWERRLALVVLTHFAKDAAARVQIDRALAKLSGDKEHYVKKAVEWLRRDLQK